MERMEKRMAEDHGGTGRPDKTTGLLQTPEVMKFLVKNLIQENISHFSTKINYFKFFYM